MSNTEERVIEKTNRNILSKKALDSLNHTQKIFPFHKSATKKQAAFDSTSMNSSGSAGKSRKIGGLARRRAARESVRNLLEFKKNFSIRDQSLGNS